MKYQQTRFPGSAPAIQKNSGSNFSWNDAAAAQAAVCEEVQCVNLRPVGEGILMSRKDGVSKGRGSKAMWNFINNRHVNAMNDYGSTLNDGSQGQSPSFRSPKRVNMTTQTIFAKSFGM